MINYVIIKDDKYKENAEHGEVDIMIAYKKLKIIFYLNYDYSY